MRSATYAATASSCARPSANEPPCPSRLDYWAKAYYEPQRRRGSSHQAAAVRALAFKGLRIVYRCWQDRTPYNEATYLNALKQCGSPLLN